MIEWRRPTQGTKMAHAYVDGVCLCSMAESGSVPVIMHLVTEFTPAGQPWGSFCSVCWRGVCRRAAS